MSSYRKLLLKNTFKVCLLLSVLFVTVMFITGYRMAKRSLVSDAENYTRLTAGKIDSAISRVQDIIALTRSNEYVRHYVDAYPTSSYSHIELINNVISQINSMPGANCHVAVARLGDNYIISESSTPLNVFLDNYGIPMSGLDSIINMFDDPLKVEPLIYISESDGTKYFTAALCDMASYSKPYLVFCVYKLNDLIEDIPPNTSLLISLDGKPFYCTSEFTQDKLIAFAEGKPSLLYNSVAEISTVSTLFGNLKYTLVMPKTRYFALINRYSLYVLLGFIVLFLLSWFISTKITNKSYGPIQGILDQLYNLDINKNTEDIEYISSAITLLTKKNKDLSGFVNKHRKNLADKFVNDLMRNLLTKEQIRHGLEVYIPNNEEMLPLAVIIADAYVSFMPDSSESNEDARSFDIIMRKIFAGEFGSAQFFNFSVMSPFVYCIVVSAEDYDGLENRIKKLLLNAESDLGVAIYSSLSAPVKSWYDLPSAFFQTHISHSIRAYSFSDSNTVVTDRSPEISIFYDPEIENRITECCIHCNEEQLKDTLRFLVFENFKTEELFPSKKSQLSLLLYALCMRIFALLNIKSDAVFDKDFNIYLELNTCENSEDYSKKLQFIFVNIIHYISSLQTVHESQYSEKMLNFIHNNYSKNITLLDLAEHMNMSQVYVSRLFKKLNHKNFKDYLIQTRINKSAQLLCENPQESINDIALKVGFNSSGSFYKAFVNTMGIQPSEYRKNHVFK